MDSMIAYVILVSIIILGVGLVLLVGTPIIEDVKSNLEFREAENFLIKMDDTIQDVAKEGEGSSRILKSGSGDYRISADEELVEFSQRTSFFDYLTRKLMNGVLMISGADVNCYEGDINNNGQQDLVMENSYIGIALSKVNGTYNTKDNIVMIKNSLSTITPTDSSIVIDGNTDTTIGTGYSLIERIGKDLPKCRIHFFMNSTLDYDIFYTLYSGADFVVVEVRNVKA